MRPALKYWDMRPLSELNDSRLVSVNDELLVVIVLQLVAEVDTGADKLIVAEDIVVLLLFF